MKSTVIVNLIFIANASFFKTGRTSPASPTWLFKNGFCLRFTHSSAHGVRMSSIRQRIKLYPVFGTTLTAGRISLLTIRPLPHLGHRRGSMPANSKSHFSQRIGSSIADRSLRRTRAQISRALHLSRSHQQPPLVEIRKRQRHVSISRRRDQAV